MNQTSFSYNCLAFWLAMLPITGVLLRTLCDRINRIGEIGYFLASFEAAITHIQELDLAEEQINLTA